MPPFRPLYKGRDLFHPSLDPPSGLLQFEPSYEFVRAARWRGLSWQAFDSLDSDAQALVLAEYRIEMRYAAVDSWDNRPSNAKKKRR